MRAFLRTPGRTFGALPVLLAVSLSGPAQGDVLSWVPTDLTGIEVTDVAIEPGGSGRIWAATNWRGLLVSSDGGRTFAPSPASGLDPRVFGIDFDPQDSSLLYAATGDGLYRVTAATAERLWQRGIYADGNARWVSVDPRDPRVLLLGATGGCIYRSADRGVTWNDTRCGGHPYRDSVGRAVFDPSGSGLVLATSSDPYHGTRLLRSADRGATWSYPEPDQAGGCRAWPNLAVDPEPPGDAYLSHRVWCASSLAHLVSRDFGLTWSSFVPAEPEAVGALAIIPSGRILSAGPGGVFRTDRTGSPWAPATVGLPSGEVRRIIALDDAGGELLLATTTGLYRTERLAEVPADPVVLPTVVDAVGRGGARFTTSFTLYNASDGMADSMAEGTVEYVASDSAGSAGSGSFPFLLPAREQLVVGDASTWLRAAGLAVPEATPGQPQVGTLTIRSSDGLWGGEVVAVARVTTPSGAGFSGTGLWSLPASSLMTTPSYLPGLRETAGERTNVAVANAGASGRITLRATFRHAGGSFTREAELGPGQCSARTTIPAPSGGAYGVSYPALTPGELPLSEAWVTGLGPASEVRSSLALLNPGMAAVSLEWTVFPGTPAGWPRGLEGTVTLQPGEWKQVLLENAGGTYRYPVQNVVVRVRKTSGPGPFAAYGVVNDGKSPGLGTGDGTYIPMSATR